MTFDKEVSESAFTASTFECSVRRSDPDFFPIVTDSGTIIIHKVANIIQKYVWHDSFLEGIPDSTITTIH
jgi:hypothetical protein